MDRKEIRRITAKHYLKLSRFSKIFVEELDGESIHQFRVEYKELRAFFRMLLPKAKIKTSRSLKHGYHIAGAIRDLQLQKERVFKTTKEDPKKPMAYIHLLQKEIEQLRPGLQDIFQENPIAESRKKTDASLPDKYTATHLRIYITQTWKDVFANLLSGHFSDDQIHQVRKHLKDLYYNGKLIEKSMPVASTPNVWNGQSKSYFEAFLDELGTFQDQCTALRLLKPHWLLSLNKFNRDQLLRIRKSWIREKVHMKMGILKKLKTMAIQGNKIIVHGKPFAGTRNL